MADRCEPICDDSGEVVAVARVSGPVSDETRAALLALAEAVRRDVEAEDPDGALGERQHQKIAAVRERAAARGGQGEDSRDCPGGCGAQVSGRSLACMPCWYQLPWGLRRRVSTADRCRDSDPERHRQAIADALAWYRDNTGGVL